MRAHGSEGRLGKRFAIVIGVAAAGVMALGPQTAAAAPGVVKYDTHLNIYKDRNGRGVFDVWGGANAKVRKCQRGRRVVVFEVRPGADRKLGTDRTQLQYGHGGGANGDSSGYWLIHVSSGDLHEGDLLYAKVRREEHDEFVCGGDRSKTIRGVPANGRERAAAAPDVVNYNTKLTITHERQGQNPNGHALWHGVVESKVRKCERGRRVTLFKQRNGADRKLAMARSHFRPYYGQVEWGVKAPPGGRVYAKVSREVHDEFVCRGDRSATYYRSTHPPSRSLGVR